MPGAAKRKIALDLGIPVRLVAPGYPTASVACCSFGSSSIACSISARSIVAPSYSEPRLLRNSRSITCILGRSNRRQS